MDIKHLIWKRLWLIAACTVILTALAVWGMTFLTPSYRAEAKLLLDTRTFDTSLRSVVSGPLSSIPDTNVARGEVEVLQSRLLAEQVIQQLDIMNSSDLSRRPLIETVLKAVSEITWMQPVLHELGLSLPAASLAAERRLADAVDAYLKRFEAFNDGRSFVLSITYTATDPRVAAQIVNAHANLYLADQRSLKQRAAERAATWLSAQVDLMRREIERKRNTIRDLREQAGLVVSAGAGGGVATPLERQVSDVAALLAKLQAEVATHQYLGQQRESDLQTLLTNLQHKREQQVRVAVKLEDLSRDVQSTEKVYEILLQRLGEIRAQIGAENADARLISSASPPRLSSFPNIMLFSGIALIIAAGLGVCLAYVVERRNHGVSGPYDLEPVNLNVMEALPAVRRRELRNRSLVDLLLQQPRSALAEKVRALRGEISKHLLGAQSHVIAITSALPDEGKTTTALLIGHSMAASGLHVLFIECDLRRPNVKEHLGYKTKTSGLVAVLRDGVALEAALITDPQSMMDILAVEEGVQRPQDLLSGKALFRLVDDARKHYDYVILDTPPVGAVSDALLTAPYVDATILVVRWQRTPLAAIKAVATKLAQHDMAVSGVVLNAANLKRATPPELAVMYRASVRYTGE